MDLNAELTHRMKAAMKARDRRTVDLIRMIKSRVTERTTAPGFTGEVDDELMLDVISAYVKQMRKARVDYEKAGAAGADAIAQIDFEVGYLEPLLPAKLDEAATRELVAGIIARDDLSGKAGLGRVMGAVMKSHKDEVDAALVRQVAEELLG